MKKRSTMDKIQFLVAYSTICQMMFTQPSDVPVVAQMLMYIGMLLNVGAYLTTYETNQ